MCDCLLWSMIWALLGGVRGKHSPVLLESLKGLSDRVKGVGSQWGPEVMQTLWRSGWKNIELRAHIFPSLKEVWDSFETVKEGIKHPGTGIPRKFRSSRRLRMSSEYSKCSHYNSLQPLEFKSSTPSMSSEFAQLLIFVKPFTTLQSKPPFLNHPCQQITWDSLHAVINLEIISSSITLLSFTSIAEISGGQSRSVLTAFIHYDIDSLQDRVQIYQVC
jgi:hypothetical protein